MKGLPPAPHRVQNTEQFRPRPLRAPELTIAEKRPRHAKAQVETAPHVGPGLQSSARRSRSHLEADGAGGSSRPRSASPSPAFPPGGSGTTFLRLCRAASSHTHAAPLMSPRNAFIWKILFLFHFLKLEYNSFTALCQFLLYNILESATRIHMSLLPESPCHHTPHPPLRSSRAPH